MKYAYFVEQMDTDQVVEINNEGIEAVTVSDMPAEYDGYFTAEDSNSVIDLCIETEDPAPVLTIKRSDSSTYELEPQEFVGSRPPDRITE